MIASVLCPTFTCEPPIAIGCEPSSDEQVCGCSIIPPVPFWGVGAAGGDGFSAASLGPSPGLTQRPGLPDDTGGNVVPEPSSLAIVGCLALIAVVMQVNRFTFSKGK